MTITFPRLGNAGRLGNQLWQIASTLGIAAAHDDDVSFPAWDYQHVFSVPDDLFDGRKGTNATTLAGHLGDNALYLQDLELWSPIADTIRKVFEPSQFAVETVDRFISKIDVPRPWLAIHVRRGDVVTGDQGRHSPLPISYYNNARRQLLGSVVVFSDDIPWCREHLPGADWFFEGAPPRPKPWEPDYESAPISDWIDLLAMARCAAHVIANSTFSWWAAWLADRGRVVYPWPWFGPKLARLDAGRMFPDDWMRLPV